MEIFLSVLVISVVIFLFIGKSNEIPHSIPRGIFKRIPEYKKRNDVMNQSEAAFFFELKKQLPQDYYIFPKMRMIDFIQPVNRDYGLRNRIWAKHVDFLICDKNFEPKIAIELNGKSHQRQDRIERDERVKIIFEDAKIPLQFINVGTNFNEQILYIKSHLI